eukprot:s253_g27.t1
MKLTIIANYGHGAFGKGDRLLARQEYLRSFLEKQDSSYFQDLSEEIMMDKGISDVKNKTFFGMVLIFNQILADWAILREASLAVDADDEREQREDTDNQEGDQGDEEQNDDEDKTKKKVWTKSQLYAAYSGKGPHQMNFDFLHEAKLREKAVILVDVAWPLYERYSQDLQHQKGNRVELLRWVSARSRGSGFRVTHAILRVLASPRLYERMRLAPRSRRPLPPDHVDLVYDTELVSNAYRFGIELGSNWTWSQLLFKYTLPFATAALLDGDRTPVMAHLKEMVEAVIRAEEKIKRNVAPPGLRDVYNSLSWTEEPFCRELMIMLRKINYSTGMEDVRPIRRLMIRLFSGSSTTREILECCFSHLQDVAARSVKNKKASPYSIWLHATGSSFIAESGMKQLVPQAQDWAQYYGEFGKASKKSMETYNKIFNLHHFQLPREKDCGVPQSAQAVVKTGWRLSGPLSHFKSSAAMATLMADMPDFNNLQFCWAGRAKYLWTMVSFLPGCAGAEEFIVLPELPHDVEFPTFVHFLHNHDVTDQSVWKRVDCIPLPPASLPVELGHLGSAWAVQKRASLLKAGLKEGLQLTVPQIKQIFFSLEISAPTGRGSGKKGNIVKLDWVKKLIQHFFPGDDPGEQLRMINCLMGKNQATLDVDLLAAVSALDAENKTSFSYIQKTCIEQFEETVFGRGQSSKIETSAEPEKVKAMVDESVKSLRIEHKSSVDAVKMRQWNLTPPDLKNLLPGRGEITGFFWARHDPNLRFFRVDYPTGFSAGISRAPSLLRQTRIFKLVEHRRA